MRRLLKQVTTLRMKWLDLARLNDRVLSPLSVYTCPEDHITIALLNVRSLLPKLPDIESDLPHL